MNNFERIKAMTVEEIAEALEDMVSGLRACDYCPVKKFCIETESGCDTVFKLWLESEVQEDDR